MKKTELVASVIDQVIKDNLSYLLNRAPTADSSKEDIEKFIASTHKQIASMNKSEKGLDFYSEAERVDAHRLEFVLDRYMKASRKNLTGLGFKAEKKGLNKDLPFDVTANFSSMYMFTACLARHWSSAKRRAEYSAEQALKAV